MGEEDELAASRTSVNAVRSELMKNASIEPEYEGDATIVAGEVAVIDRDEHLRAAVAPEIVEEMGRGFHSRRFEELDSLPDEPPDGKGGERIGGTLVSSCA